MIRIPQHSKQFGSVDILSIANLLRRHLVIQKWEMSVQWCLGENSMGIEESSENSFEYLDADFVEAYKGIQQTIDGEFLAMTNIGNIKITVFDSSYWEIVNCPENIEEAIVGSFGVYK